MKFYLIVTKGKKAGFPIPISVDLFMIGSGKECQLRTKYEGAPERHCCLVTRDKKVFIRDLNSGEPVLVNGSLLPPGEEWPLHKKDQLEIGPMGFLLQFREHALSKRDLEEWALGCLDQSVSHNFEDPDEFISTERETKADTASQAAAAILGRLAAIRGEVHGRLRVGREGTVTVIRFNDRYLVEEAEISLINKELHDHLNKSNLRVLLDFKNVKRMSSAAVHMIDELCSWLKPWGSSLALCRVRPELQDILKRLTMHNKIPHFADKDQALKAKW